MFSRFWLAPFYCCCCSGWPSLALASQNAGVSAATVAEPSPMASPDLSQCQASAALHDSFMPSKPVPPQWLLSYQVHPPRRVRPLPFWTQLVCADPEETLPRSHLSGAGFLSALTSQPQLTSISCPSSTKVPLHWCWPLVDHGWCFSPLTICTESQF